VVGWSLGSLMQLLLLADVGVLFAAAAACETTRRVLTACCLI